MGLKKRLGTSNLYTKLDPIINLIAEVIDNDQEIKRLMCYMTKSPCTNKGRTYDGKLIEQRDLKNSLLEDSEIEIKTINGNTETKTIEKRIYKSSYIAEKVTSNFPVMFIHSYYDDVKQFGNNIFAIDIFVPSVYEELVYTNRLHDIMIRIADLLHNSETDIESSEELGNLTFKIKQGSSEGKPAKSINTITTTIKIYVDDINSIIGNGDKF